MIKNIYQRRFYKQFTQINKQDDPFVFVELTQSYDKPLDKQLYSMVFKVNCDNKEDNVLNFTKKYKLEKNYRFVGENELIITVSSHQDFIKLYKLFVDSFWFGEDNFKLYLTCLEHHYFWWSKRINEIQLNYDEQLKHNLNELKANDEKDKVIELMQKSIGESDQIVSELKVINEENQIKVNGLDKVITEKNHEIKGLEEQIIELNKKLLDLESKEEEEQYFKQLEYEQIKLLILNTSNAPVLKQKLKSCLELFINEKLYYLYALIFESNVLTASSYTATSKYKMKLDRLLQLLDKQEYTDNVLEQLINLTLTDDSIDKLIEKLSTETLVLNEEVNNYEEN